MHYAPGQRRNRLWNAGVIVQISHSNFLCKSTIRQDRLETELTQKSLKRLSDALGMLCRWLSRRSPHRRNTGETTALCAFKSAEVSCWLSQACLWQIICFTSKLKNAHAVVNHCSQASEGSTVTLSFPVNPVLLRLDDLDASASRRARAKLEEIQMQRRLGGGGGGTGGGAGGGAAGFVGVNPFD